MLNRIFRRYRVSEVHLCLPFVQITMEVGDGTESVHENKETIAPEVSPARPVAADPMVNLAVRKRTTAPTISVTPFADDLYNELCFRIATEIDMFGPVFDREWSPLSAGLELHSGDYLWLRLYCQNRGDRVLHHVRIAMEGIAIAEKKRGIFVRGLSGWPRIPVRDVFAGHELAHLNPGEDYSLHCVLRAPLSGSKGKSATFAAVEPDFSILKQLH